MEKVRIETEKPFTVKELKKYLAEKFDIKVSKIFAKEYLEKSRIFGKFIKDKKVKYDFEYIKKTGELVILKYYKVEYYRSAPAGYDNCISSISVLAETEQDAIEQAVAECSALWGAERCSKFSIINR